MKTLHLTRAARFIIMALAVLGLYSIIMAFNGLGTAADSQFLARMGVPGLGIVIICAIGFTILSELSLIKHLNDKR